MAENIRIYSNIRIFVTLWPERPKGAKDKVRMPEEQKAGPKGRQLDVRAQRAPRLLVSIYRNIYYMIEIDIFSNCQIVTYLRTIGRLHQLAGVDR